MADKPSFLDFNSWSTRTWTWSLGAGVVALILCKLFGEGWFWALIIGVIVFLAVAWWLQRDAAVPTTTTAYTPPVAPRPVAPGPVTPSAPETPAAPLTPPAPVIPVAPVAAPVAAVGARATEGNRPAGLAGPRDGGADNLKRIKGVGPKLEELLHSLGFYHFDQIAAWTETELAWVDSHLEGFNGRASRDDWIGQSKILAAGGETEHSQRVDRGEST